MANGITSAYFGSDAFILIVAGLSVVSVIVVLTLVIAFIVYL